jgi:hypothetical protein
MSSARAPLLARRVAQRERKLDVVERGEPGKQARLLEHDADAVRVGRVDRPALDVDRAGGLVTQARHHHQQRGLAAAARADDDDETPGTDRHGDVGQRRHRALTPRISVT